jgi:hypothetical protein
MNLNHEKIVLVIAETQYKLRNKGQDLDTAEPDVRAVEIKIAEETCDALTQDKLVAAAE